MKRFLIGAVLTAGLASACSSSGGGDVVVVDPPAEAIECFQSVGAVSEACVARIDGQIAKAQGLTGTLDQDGVIELAKGAIASWSKASHMDVVPEFQTSLGLATKGVAACEAVPDGSLGLGAAKYCATMHGLMLVASGDVQTYAFQETYDVLRREDHVFDAEELRGLSAQVDVFSRSIVQALSATKGNVRASAADAEDVVTWVDNTTTGMVCAIADRFGTRNYLAMRAQIADNLTGEAQTEALAELTKLDEATSRMWGQAMQAIDTGDATLSGECRALSGS